MVQLVRAWDHRWWQRPLSAALVQSSGVRRAFVGACSPTKPLPFPRPAATWLAEIHGRKPARVGVRGRQPAWFARPYRVRRDRIFHLLEDLLVLPLAPAGAQLQRPPQRLV